MRAARNIFKDVDGDMTDDITEEPTPWGGGSEQPHMTAEPMSADKDQSPGMCATNHS